MNHTSGLALMAILLVTGCQASDGSPSGASSPASATTATQGPAPAAVPTQFQAGQTLYGQYCQQCHGLDARGSDKGPSFLDPVYRPGHHADGAFVAAAIAGVRAHHWQFGDMPPVQGATSTEVEKITPYIRYLQRQAGVE